MKKEKFISDLLDYLNEGNTSEDNKIILLDEATIERENYFVFFYNSEKYLKEGDLLYALAGNAPVIVDKKTGKRHFTGTAMPIEFYIQEYEKTYLI